MELNNNIIFWRSTLYFKVNVRIHLGEPAYVIIVLDLNFAKFKIPLASSELRLFRIVWRPKVVKICPQEGMELRRRCKFFKMRFQIQEMEKMMGISGQRFLKQTKIGIQRLEDSGTLASLCYIELDSSLWSWQTSETAKKCLYRNGTNANCWWS